MLRRLFISLPLAAPLSKLPATTREALLSSGAAPVSMRDSDDFKATTPVIKTRRITFHDLQTGKTWEEKWEQRLGT